MAVMAVVASKPCTLRAGVEKSTAKVGTAQAGATVAVLELRRTASGTQRARTADGWLTATTTEGKELIKLPSRVADDAGIDRHPADGGIRVACLPDPVKVIKKAGYPKRSVQDRLQECGMQYTQIGVRDVLGGKLTTGAYDVLCIPGGYAPNWCDKLGPEGSKAIEAFVAGGGGFVGICAGAYIGSNWDLGLIDVDLPLIQRWARGKTDACALRLTEHAAMQLGEVAAESRLAVRYCNGPLMEAHEGVEILATFDSELRGRRSKYPAEMRGTAAIVSGRYRSKDGAVSHFWACNGSPCLRQCVHGASLGGGGGWARRAHLAAPGVCRRLAARAHNVPAALSTGCWRTRRCTAGAGAGAGARAGARAARRR
jgi:putative intracellular protease/amidase